MSEKERVDSEKEVEVEVEETETDESADETVDVKDSDDSQESESELEKYKQEAMEYKDKYIRAHAEFDNMKKRLERDKASAVSFANETFAKDLLAVIDSFESALVSMEQIEGDEAVEKIKEGMKLTYEQLVKVLSKHGVEEVAHEGVFDPNFHQVVHQVDSDEHDSGEIVNVLQKGYLMRDRLLRPAMVATKK
jgi:molecular chaperone GrpE